MDCIESVIALSYISSQIDLSHFNEHCVSRNIALIHQQTVLMQFETLKQFLAVIPLLGTYILFAWLHIWCLCFLVCT